MLGYPLKFNFANFSPILVLTMYAVIITDRLFSPEKSHLSFFFTSTGFRTDSS
jgi:hypothetical protein